MLHCRTAYRAIFGASTYAVLVAKTVSADKALAGANLIGYAYPTTADVNASHWRNFGSVLTSTYTPAAGAVATDATVPKQPASNTAKVANGVVRAAVSGVGLVLAAVVAAALAL